MFTAGGDVGEALALAPFPLAIADIEVDMDRGGQSLVAIGRDLNHEAVLQRRKATQFNLTKVSERQKVKLFHLWKKIALRNIFAIDSPNFSNSSQ